MADRIKGITIEIGGDATGLSTALSEVNSRTKSLQKELKDVEKLLKFDPNNVELLAQRQQLLTQSIDETTNKLNQLKEAEQQVQQQFERGEIGEEQYRAFRREIQDTEQSLRRYEESLQDMQGEQEKVGQGTRQLTTLFEATGSSVEDYSNIIGQRLVRAIQNGTATSRDLEYAFQRIGRETIGASGDIERLRTSLQSVDDGNPIANVRRDLQQMEREATDAQGAVKELSGELTGMVAGLAAGGGISGVIEQALDLSSLETKIDITFEVPEESKESVKSAIKGIQAYGIDAEDALEGVRRQWALNKNESDVVNGTIVRAAGAIASAYSQIDFTELIQETNEVAAALEISNEDAIALYNALLKAGFPPEQLDTVAEYGQQMKDAGYNAQQIQAIFEAG
jgi:phage-related minor tail protein